MKKVSIILFLLILGIAFNGFSQAPAPSDFFVGKWEAVNLPEGDMNRGIHISRNGKELTVSLNFEKFANYRVEEHATELIVFFDMVTNPHMPKESIRVKDIRMTLTKIDDDTLKMQTIQGEATVKRVK